MNEHDPADGADHVEGEKAPVPHLTDAGDERRERANDRHEARDDDRLTAVALVELLRSEEVLLVEEDASPRCETPWARCGSRSSS